MRKIVEPSPIRQSFIAACLRPRAAAAALIGLMLVAGCSAGAPSPSAPAGGSVWPSAADPWGEDLAQLDERVRALHPNPFANADEATWVAKLDALRIALPTASPDEQLVLVASLVGLLDTHSALGAPTHAYDAVIYPFTDGWYVIRAKDPELVGARLVSIGGLSVADVEAAMRPLVPADNESGELDGLEGAIVTVEYLRGLGIVDDPATPQFAFEQTDGTERIEDLTFSDWDAWNDHFDVIGDLMGDAPEAVARRDEPVWTRLDAATKTFLIAYNDYTDTQLQPAIVAMSSALDDGSATRVLLDMRYIRGGNGSLSAPLLDALTSDPRINHPGGIIVLIGRENVSAGTIVAEYIRTRTSATFIGEMTPARAYNFVCPCTDVILRNSGFVVSLPTTQDDTGEGDDGLAVEPDIPFSLRAADFFAGRDPALELALSLLPDGTAP